MLIRAKSLNQNHVAFYNANFLLSSDLVNCYEDDHIFIYNRILGA
jgi:hypothetical protein